MGKGHPAQPDEKRPGTERSAMNSPLRPRLTFSNVLACLALFIALGGTATAIVLPRNSVGTKQLKRRAVTSKKIAPKAVIGGKLGPAAVGPGNIGNGAVTASKLARNSVTNPAIANGVVGTNKLGNGVVTTVKLADGSVTAAKLADEIGPLLGTLKSGQTLRGMFTVGGSEAAAKVQTGVSFQFPLLNAPAANVIDPATATTAACPGITGGNGQTPQAAAGQLCLYVTNTENAATPTVPGVTLTRLGFGVQVASSGTGDFSVTGQWAVTAP
jgi:hypothetical protein